MSDKLSDRIERAIEWVRSRQASRNVMILSMNLIGSWLKEIRALELRVADLQRTLDRMRGGD